MLRSDLLSRLATNKQLCEPWLNPNSTDITNQQTITNVSLLDRWTHVPE